MLSQSYPTLPYPTEPEQQGKQSDLPRLDQYHSFLGLSPQMLLPQTAGSKFKNMTPSFLIGVVSDFWSFGGSWEFVIVQEDWLQVAIYQGQGRKKEIRDFFLCHTPHPSFPPI